MPSLGPAPETDPFDSLAAALIADTALPELRGMNTRDDWRKLAAELKDDPDHVAFQITELIDRISVQELDHLLNRKEDQTLVPGRIESTELVRHRKLRRGKPKAQIALFIDQLEDLFTSGFSLRASASIFCSDCGVSAVSKGLCHFGVGERLLRDLPAIP